MQQQLLEQYSHYPATAPSAMGYGRDVTVDTCDRAEVTVQSSTAHPTSEPQFIWHCSEYDF